jgi:hypothetical protein
VPTRFAVIDKAVVDAERAVSSLQPLDAAAKAMTKVMREGTVRAIGADLRLSNFRGDPVEFKEQRGKGRATLTIGGGTYALADGGRKQAKRRIRSKRRKRRGKRAPALATPMGPRRSVSGSRSRGLRITDQYSPRALDEAVAAAQRVVVDLFTKAV